MAFDLFDIEPILIYPSKVYHNDGIFPKPKNCIPGKKYQMYYDLGVYGIPKSTNPETVI